MSAIIDALAKLEDSIGRLEGAAAHLEVSLSGRQRDMFGGGPAPAAGNAVDAGLVAAKLDTIIEQAETLLREGRA